MLLAILLTLALPSFAAGAEDIEVYVSITDGENKLAYAKVKVTDRNQDGIHSIDEALYDTHVSFYEGGATAGYQTAASEFGCSLVKLWGKENGMSFGYYVNDLSAMSLDDPVKAKDHIHAFAYTDTVGFSDTYSYFDKPSYHIINDESITLTLKAVSFDAEWNPVSVPVKNAYITFNGEKTEFKTDKEGKVTIPFQEGGQFLVGAVSDSMTLVPPVCVVNVKDVTIPLGVLILVLALAVAGFAFVAWYLIVRKKKKKKA